jgi:hypothetical protein
MVSILLDVDGNSVDPCPSGHVDRLSSSPGVTTIGT